MFTGIVEELGTVQRAGPRLRIECQSVLAGAAAGSSIAVNGVCLTAVGLDASGFSADLAPETLRRSNLGYLRPGSKVNLERPLALSDRLSGHLVQGHVDGVGEVVRVEQRKDARLVDIAAPAEVAQVSVPLGSITVDGVSLTVNAMPAPTIIQISLIPFTLQHTTLADRRPGDRVHLEADTIGKYVRALLEKREG
jgi:riboflavin synthase